jgi:hypothetical protein
VRYYARNQEGKVREIIKIRQYVTWQTVNSSLVSANDYSVAAKVSTATKTSTPLNSAKVFTSETPRICSITTSGMVSNQSPGTCTVRATALGDDNLASSQASVKSWQVLPDLDFDGIIDSADNCPDVANGPASDPAANLTPANPQWNDDVSNGQNNTDGRGLGDICNDRFDLR